MPAHPVYNEAQASTLNTPEGPIPYWVLFDGGYGENFGDDANLTTVHIAVYWDDASAFKTYALGTTKANPGGNYFYRHPPLKCQYADKQYLTDLVKVDIHAGLTAAGATQYHVPGFAYDNWFSFDNTYARVVYKATFRNLPYLVLTDGVVSGGAAGAEMQRYVSRRYRVNPREFKRPPCAYETYSAANPALMSPNPACQPILEVGFTPFYDIEVYTTWHRVPWEWVPWTAIEDCLLLVNDDDWDYEPVYRAEGEGDPGPVEGEGGWQGEEEEPTPAHFDYERGWYGKGTILFGGLVRDMEPYRDGSGQWLCDIPYLFKYQPNGWNNLPRVDGTWAPVRVRDTNPPKPLYLDADLWQLFVPEPT